MSAITADPVRRVDRPIEGIALNILAYGCMCLQDAVMKHLVADQSVVTALFWRSLVVLLACLVIGRERIVRSVANSPVKGRVARRALVSLTAWLLYYRAARDLSFAEMTTLYFSAPVIGVALAVLILKERAGPLQWVSVVLGFVGVVVAIRPAEATEPLAIAMVLGAAALWAYTYVMIRQLDARMGVGAQVLATNLVFVLGLGVLLPWQGSMPNLGTVATMGLVGLVGGLGQVALFASYTRASVTVLAPFEYSGLIWAFLLSALVWGIVPDGALVVGATLIAVSGVMAAVAARRTSRRVQA